MTELDEILAHLVNHVDGAMVAAVGGMDGLLVEQFPRHGQDLAAVTAELTVLLSNTSTAFSDNLDGGKLEEIIVTAERVVGYTRILGDELFIIIAMNPAGNIGKARLYSQQAAEKILEALA